MPLGVYANTTAANPEDIGGVQMHAVSTATPITDGPGASIGIMGGDGSSNACAQVSEGLVAWWDFSSLKSIISESDFSHEGTSHDDHLLPGKVGTAYHLSQEHRCYLRTSVDAGFWGEFTAEALVRPATVTNMHIVLDWNDGFGNHGVQLMISETNVGPGSISAFLRDVTGRDNHLASRTNVVKANVWQHIALTYSKANGVGQLFVDGELVASSNLGSFTLQTSYPLCIGVGVDYSWLDGRFVGAIDELSLYKRALSSTEIRSIFTAGDSGKCPPKTPPQFLSEAASEFVTDTGWSVTMAPMVTGAKPITYQWRKCGTNLPGATSAWLWFPTAEVEDSGVYSLLASNAYGVAVGRDSRLTVMTVQGDCALATGGGLAAWWTFQNGLVDGISGIVLSNTGGVEFEAGKVGNGYSFLNTNTAHYLSTPMGALNVGNGEGMTIEAWIKPSSLSEQQVIAEWNDGQGNTGVSLFFSMPGFGGNGSLIMNFADVNGQGHYLASGPNALRLNAWQHVTATYDRNSGVARLYLDGTPIATEILGWFTPQTTYAMNVGRRISGPGAGSQFQGLIDELTVYHRPLNEFEVKSIHWSGPTGKCPLGAPPAVTRQPTSKQLFAGETLRLEVEVTGAEPIFYQWFRNEQPLPGANSPVLEITNVMLAHQANYFLGATNVWGMTVSTNVFVTVTDANLCAPVAPGIVAWWRGDRAAEDELGLSPGMLVNGLGVGSGKVGAAYSFSGYGDHVRVADHPRFHFTNALTVEAWVKPAAGRTQTIISKWDATGSGANSWTLELSSWRTLDLSVSGGSVSSGLLAVPLNVWSHIAGTCDGNKLRIYVNGELRGETQLYAGAGIRNSTNAIGIGARVGGVAPGSVGQPFTGMIDEPAIYNRALTADEIKAIAQAGAGKCTGLRPIITRNPAPQLLSPGQTLRLEAEVGGTLPIHYQWYRNHEKLLGATSLVLTISNVTVAHQGTYYMAATNLYGSGVSSSVQATIITSGSAPWIVRHPEPVMLSAGQTAVFAVEASGSEPLSYAWRKDGVYLPGATNRYLTIFDVKASDIGLYSARVTNLWGSVFSGSAYLTVTQSVPSCVSAPSGLITWWRGEFTGADQMGYLPSYSNTTKFAVGKVGYAFNFDGTKDTVTNHMPGLTNVLDNYTYEFWAKPTAGRMITPEATQGLYGTGGQRYAIFPLNGVWGAVGSGVSVGTNGVSVFEHGGDYLSSLLVYNATNWDWVHVAVVYSNRQPSLYLNGALVRTGLRSTRSSFPSTSLGMDNAMPSDYGHYAGLLDEVSIYTRRLSSQEIQSIYAAGAAGKCVSTGSAPVLTQHPAPQQIYTGQTLLLSAFATGSEPLHYTWFRSGQGVQAGYARDLVISNVTAAHQGVYYVRVTNNFGAALSSNVWVTVSSGTPLEITRQPTSSMVATGAMAFFDVAVRGTGPINYAWRKDGVPISYGTNPWLIITNVTPNDAGLYSVVVVSPLGTNVSDSALLTVYGHTCLEPAGGLITWWRGEFNGLDNQNLVPLTPEGVGYEPAKVLNGFRFNGTNAVMISNSPGLTNYAGNHTIEFWARPEGAVGTIVESTVGSFSHLFQPWVVYPDEGRAGRAGVGVAVGTNGVRVFERSGATYQRPGTTAAPLVWNGALSPWDYAHVAVVYSNRQPSLYINGLPVRTGLQSPTTSYPSTQLGGPWNPSDPTVFNYGYYKGGLDEVSIYSRSLSSHEVQRIYLAGSAGKCPPISGSKPAITQQPMSQVVTQGQTATFSVTATGTGPLHYLWTRNQSPVPGGTNAVLVLDNAQPSQEGGYQVRVTNLYGTVWSGGAQLRVLPAPTPQLRVASVTNVVIGTTFYLPIEFTGRGVENAMSFSLAYPASRMQFDGLVSGSAATNATLLANTNMVSSGFLGIAIALPADTVFRSGVVLWARFVAKTNQLPGTATISIQGTPIRMEMADVNGNVLFFSKYSGTVSFTAGIEGDVAPLGRPDNLVRLPDWVLIGRMVAGKLSASPGLEFMKADCSPRTTLGDGRLTVADWAQAGRYVAGLDPVTPAGGPSVNTPFMASARKLSDGPSRKVTVRSAGLKPGSDGAVTVEVLARGGENALGFSLAFDPAALEYRSVAVASAASGAALEVNSEQVDAGRLGVMLALPAGNSFEAGAQTALRLTFHARASHSTNTALVFADQPVMRELADVTAEPVPTTFISGSVTVDPRPVLSIEARDNRVNLRWPAWATDCVLETTDDATLQKWTAAPGNPTVTPDACAIELPLSGKGQFYRLRQK